MKILQVHNYYRQYGGEDVVVSAEKALLKENGHEVKLYSLHNDQVDTIKKISLSKKTIWNHESYQEISNLIAEYNPDVIHVHNTFPLISPSVYYAASDSNVPVVQTLHNYRFLCPASTFYRNGEVCEKCLGCKLPWPGVLHACYRNSYSASGVTSIMLYYHNLKKTYSKKIDLFISMTNFGKNKFIEGGLPGEKIVVKPHFIEDDLGKGVGKGGFALYVGRLTEEKGIKTLLKTWEDENVNYPLKIIGDGPLSDSVKKASNKNQFINWLGFCEREKVLEMMGEATFLVVPSEWYETFGLIVIEAFSKGTPVLVSDIGAVGELVDQGRTGYKFEPGNHKSLARKIEYILSNKDSFSDMRARVRDEYLKKYSKEKNYEQLMSIYNKAINEA